MKITYDWVLVATVFTLYTLFIETDGTASTCTDYVSEVSKEIESCHSDAAITGTRSVNILDNTKGFDALEASIFYTRAAVPGDANGINLFDKQSTFGLRDPTAFSHQHGTVEVEAGMSDWVLKNELVPVRTVVENGRGRDFRLMEHGFELVDVLSSTAEENSDEKMPSTETTMQSFGSIGVIMNDYARAIESMARRVTGAKAAHVYGHTWRGGELGSRFGAYAHTDVGAKSWCLKGLKTLEERRIAMPPFLQGIEFPSNVTRYAVVTAWQLLQGGDKSHLAMLDHSTLQEDDVLDFTMLAANNTFGSNYRLKYPEGDEQFCRHKWYYWPKLEKESELIFFLAHDSTFNLPIVHSQFHAAFTVDSVGSRIDTERRSVDTRILLLF